MLGRAMDVLRAMEEALPAMDALRAMLTMDA